MDRLHALTVTSIDDIVTVISPKGGRFSNKNRKNYGLSFCTSGQIT